MGGTTVLDFEISERQRTKVTQQIEEMKVRGGIAVNEVITRGRYDFEMSNPR